jgi:hypothetical protein
MERVKGDRSAGAEPLKGAEVGRAAARLPLTLG